MFINKLKREQCDHTKHDSSFSNWKILIGASDWEDYSKGKEGCTRYRNQNRPQTFGPGVYELGIVVSRNYLGREIYKFATDPCKVVVVYLGKSENVRERLQCYGRNGAHLSNACSSIESSSSTQMRHSLFHHIFSKGFPIVYRWAPMENNGDAIKTEAQLLNTFDYAWNTTNNGTRRPYDILQMLDKIASTTITFSYVAKSLIPFIQNKVGIPIKSNKFPVTYGKSDEVDNYGSFRFLSKVFKFNRSHPMIVQNITSGAIENNAIICGVILNDGSICTRPPVEKRVRCFEHRGMRINVSNAKAIGAPKLESEIIDESITKTIICGIILDDGSTCRKQPVKARKRCHEHKGMRINMSNAKAIGAPKLE